MLQFTFIVSQYLPFFWPDAIWQIILFMPIKIFVTECFMQYLTTLVFFGGTYSTILQKEFQNTIKSCDSVKIASSVYMTWYQVPHVHFDGILAIKLVTCGMEATSPFLNIASVFRRRHIAPPRLRQSSTASPTTQVFLPPKRQN